MCMCFLKIWGRWLSSKEKKKGLERVERRKQNNLRCCVHFLKSVDFKSRINGLGGGEKSSCKSTITEDMVHYWLACFSKLPKSEKTHAEQKSFSSMHKEGREEVVWIGKQIHVFSLIKVHSRPTYPDFLKYFSCSRY